MLIRIVDYVGNPGGGVRFIVEAVAALASLPDAPRIEFVSDGHAFSTYEKAFRERCPAVAVRRLRPANNPRVTHRWYHRLPGMTIVPTLLRGGDRASLLHRFDVPPDVFRDADAVWLPWIHGHRVIYGHDRVVATYHDTIGVEFAGIVPPDVRKRAMANEAEWCCSDALITVTANATAASLERLYNVPRDRFPVVRLSAIHDRPAAADNVSHVEGPWQSQPYLLCPANTSIHKNHDVLLEGYVRWGAKMPLVLTGSGTDFLTITKPTPRSRALRNLASRLNLDERKVIGLGYISDERYFAILKGCHALVMPTLAEGGGSFPVGEALRLHIPVLSSDIPVMRESTEVLSVTPLWFDPRDPADLARGFEALVTQRDELHAALKTRGGVLNRTWAQVAEDYRELFKRVADLQGDGRDSHRPKPPLSGAIRQ